MKYIDSEKLISEIERMRKINRKAFEADHIESDIFHGRAQAINHLFDFITSLQQEQPSLPSNLDEVEKEYAENVAYGEPGRVFIASMLGFRDGAQWMAGQGYAREVEVKEDAGGYPYIPCIELYDYDKDEPLFKPGDKVVAQIRKGDIVI